MSCLEVRNLLKSFPSPDGGASLVVEVEKFSLRPEAQCAMKGESGSGKTTFLHLLAGILKPDEGEVILDGLEVTQLSESERDRLRATSIGYVFQSFNLLQGFTSLENVQLAMTFSGRSNRASHLRSDKAWAKQLLDRVGLSDRLDYYPRQLSVGQQQRVALARALANRPKLVLADEPTGNLDPQNAAKALSLLADLCRENGSSLLLVSHEDKVIDAFDRQLSWEEVNRSSGATEV